MIRSYAEAALRQTGLREDHSTLFAQTISSNSQPASKRMTTISCLQISHCTTREINVVPVVFAAWPPFCRNITTISTPPICQATGVAQNPTLTVCSCPNNLNETQIWVEYRHSRGWIIEYPKLQVKKTRITVRNDTPGTQTDPTA